MTWAEAKKAFKDQTPVTLINPAVSIRPIHCTRIAEIMLRCQLGGKPYPIVGAMDRNERCIYHAPPESFSVTKEDET